LDLRGALIRAPWWVWALVLGTLFGLGQFTVQLVSGRSVVPSAVGAAVAALLFGVIAGPGMHRRDVGHRAAMGDIPMARRRTVNRAARRGPVPTDPELRRAALAVLALQLETYRRQRWAIVFWSFMIAVSVLLAVPDGGWWLLAVPLFTGFLALQLWMPRQLRRRQLLLAEDAAVGS
jgi:hypothetical protein